MGGKGVTVIPDADTVGRAWHRKPPRSYQPAWNTSFRTEKRARHLVMARLAGWVSEYLQYGPGVRRRHCAEDDFYQAQLILGDIAGSEEEVSAWIDPLTIKTKNLLSQPSQWKAVKEVASALVQHGHLRAKEVRDIVRTAGTSASWERDVPPFSPFTTLPQ
jgi:hypothetical protein